MPVMSITCDGPSCNRAMMSDLGVSLDSRNIVPFFMTENGHKVYLLLDFCHMVKLTRNCFEKQGGFVDHLGRKIEWKYLTELVQFQSQQGFRCGNKITKAHIHFQRSKMSVRLATQLLSASVADSLEYCMDYLKLPQFQVKCIYTGFFIMSCGVLI